ncbi:hypothetical protein ABVV53_09960 [Novosphingobium sp. RD2P27]|uniref:Uncharacterized protein n=1 Tax=Novosphingobium kalidii TaxID=3230299 RepID=A0ABV2D1P5_9SPHN
MTHVVLLAAGLCLWPSQAGAKPEANTEARKVAISSIPMTLQGADSFASTGEVHRFAEGALAPPARIMLRRASFTDRMPRQSVALYVLVAHDR